MKKKLYFHDKQIYTFHGWQISSNHSIPQHIQLKIIHKLGTHMETKDIANH